MKKVLIFFMLLLMPFLVNAAEITKICRYTNDRILVNINIYDNGDVKSAAWLVSNGTTSGKYHSERKIGNTYTDVNNCPKYVLATYPGHDDKKFYVSNTKSELESLSSDKGFKMVDFETYDLYDAVNGGYIVSQILDLEVETEENESETLVCNYSNEITGCNNCEISLEFWKKGSSYDVGESSVVAKKVVKGNITSINLVGDEWNKREYNTSLHPTVVPFSEYLSYGLCPEGLFFDYNSSSRNINIYTNQVSYNNSDDSDSVDNIVQTPSDYEDKINYNSLCEDQGIKQTMKFIGYLIQVIRWIVPLIIIVLGMIDFGKATIASDEKALSKATASLIRRLVAGLVIFFIPTIVLATLSAVEITRGIEEETNSQFGACTKCLFGAHKDGYCEILKD